MKLQDNIDEFVEMTALTKFTPLNFETVNSQFGSQMKLKEKLAKFEKKAHCLLAGMAANSMELTESDESNEEALSNLNVMRAKLKLSKKASVESQELYKDQPSERKNPRRKRQQIVLHHAKPKEQYIDVLDEDSKSGDDYKRKIVHTRDNREPKL